MSRSKISVIIPVYNIERYIERCIKSVIEQTYHNLEIILVDDGSTDASGEICDRYEKYDHRIRVIHKENGGLSDARNAGLEIATGDYIGYVDGDDWIDLNMYEEMLQAMEDCDAELAICRYKSIYSGEIVDTSSHTIVPMSVDEVLDVHINEHPQYVIHNSVWSRLFKRQIVRDLWFPVGHNSEDIVYSTKALLRCTQVVYLDTAYYNYVCDRQDSIMNVRRGQRMIRDEIPFFRAQIELIGEAGYKELARKAAYMFYRRILYYYTELRKNKENKVYAKELVKQVRKNRKQIKKLYKQSFVKCGDRVRMRLFCFSPALYAKVVKWYDAKIIPMRLKRENSDRKVWLL